MVILVFDYFYYALVLLLILLSIVNGGTICSNNEVILPSSQFGQVVSPAVSAPQKPTLSVQSHRKLECDKQRLSCQINELILNVMFLFESATYAMSLTRRLRELSYFLYD